jgi:hypothetical protein
MQAPVQPHSLAQPLPVLPPTLHPTALRQPPAAAVCCRGLLRRRCRQQRCWQPRPRPRSAAMHQRRMPLVARRLPQPPTQQRSRLLLAAALQAPNQAAALLASCHSRLLARPTPRSRQPQLWQHRLSRHPPRLRHPLAQTLLLPRRPRRQSRRPHPPPRRLLQSPLRHPRPLQLAQHQQQRRRLPMRASRLLLLPPMQRRHQPRQLRVTLQQAPRPRPSTRHSLPLACWPLPRRRLAKAPAARATQQAQRRHNHHRQQLAVPSMQLGMQQAVPS